MVAVVACPATILQFFDNAGKPAVGGSVLTQVGGVNYPTYSDSAGTTPLPNPIPLNSRGEVSTAAGASSQLFIAANTVYTFTLSDVGGNQLNVASYVAGGLASNGQTPGGRLTLTTGLPVTTSDVSGAATIFYTPYTNDIVQLYDGTSWLSVEFSELSQALSDSTKSPAAAAINSNYDMLVWNDAGTLRCTRGPAWTSDTARGTGAGTTELELFQGRYVNKNAITNGPGARRGTYVGSIRTDGSAQANDTVLKRHVWNNYNRSLRPMLRNETAANWTYNTNAFRQANANAANQLDFLVGISVDPLNCSTWAEASTSNGTAVAASGGIGIDSTTVNSAQIRIGGATISNSGVGLIISQYKGFPGLGRHTAAWLENGQGSAGTTTWFGVSIGELSAGITADFFA